MHPKIPNLRVLTQLFIGGLCGHLVWEVFARFLTRALLGGPLEPAALIISLFQNLLGTNPGRPLAELLHYVTGIVLYPLGYYLLTRFVFSRGPIFDGLLWGVITWILALGVFASMAGLPFMLGFIPLTWFSLVGHLAYALVAALVFELLLSRFRTIDRAAQGQHV